QLLLIVSTIPSSSPTSSTLLRLLHSFPTRRSSDLRQRHWGQGRLCGISIHAPREGSDYMANPKYGAGLEISIHAPREGSDLILIDRKSTRLNSSHVSISYAVFCLKKKK